MNYSRRIQVAMLLGAGLYSLAYLSDRLRDEIEDQLPFIGLIALLVVGACVGMYSACLVIPRSFYDSSEGQKWMTGLTGAKDYQAFRSFCKWALGFLVLGSVGVLSFVFS